MVDFSVAKTAFHTGVFDEKNEEREPF